ncbi:MAG: DUF2948 family protein [Pseudomonadota bacterium]
MTDLKLIALDEEDLAVVSAQLQDAVVRVADLQYLARDRRFVAIVNRFDWLAAEKEPARRRATYERRRTALRLDHVKAVRLKDISRADTARVLSLLALRFERLADDQPDGTVTLTFSDGAAVAIDVEAIECELRDLGPVWATRSKPEHDLSGAARDDAPDATPGKVGGTGRDPNTAE